MDQIRINDLSVRCIIGTEGYERVEKQEVIVNLTLFVDLTEAGRRDELEYTVDYSDLKGRIYEMAEESDFQLIEALAREIADVALEYDRVEKVKVSVKKPLALRFTRSAEVEITRSDSP